MDVLSAVSGRRTVRLFTGEAVDKDRLTAWIDAARLAPSAANKQPIVFGLVTQRDKVERVFKYTRWAGYLKGERTPSPDGLPGAWILFLIDKEISQSGYQHDVGAAAQSIQLCAWAEGVGSCWMGAIDRPGIMQELGLDEERYILDTVLALGVPAESPDTCCAKGDIRYFLSEEGQLIVPKRPLEEVLMQL